MWPRRRELANPVTVGSCSEILKECYPQFNSPEMRRPEAFCIANKFGWITSNRFYAEPRVPTGRTNPGLSESIYANHPFLGLLKKKDTSWR